MIEEEKNVRIVSLSSVYDKICTGFYFLFFTKYF